MKLVRVEEPNGWVFETEELSGFLAPFGERHGVKTCVHRPTGLDVVHPSYDVLNMFLLFSTNLCMGQARQLERAAEQDGDSVVVSFEPSKEHRTRITARYTFLEPNLVDLSITVASEWVYPAYELFLSNYFPPEFRPHVYVRGCAWSPGGGADEWIAPQVNDVFVGTGLVFPRDQHVSPRSVDGRWNRIWALYQWNPQRYYAAPLMYQADSEYRVAAIMMARPEDAFAVITGYDSPNLDDPFKGQNPLYFSLFGDDLLPGSERTARVRLEIAALEDRIETPLAAYRRFVGE